MHKHVFFIIGRQETKVSEEAPNDDDDDDDDNFFLYLILTDGIIFHLK